MGERWTDGWKIDGCTGSVGMRFGPKEKYNNVDHRTLIKKESRAKGIAA